MTEIRCPNCNQLLFKASGMGTIIEIICERCKALINWPTLTAVIIKEPKKDAAELRKALRKHLS